MIKDFTTDPKEAPPSWIRKTKEREWANSQPTFVYFITNGQEVKIGVSMHPEKRIKEIQSSNPLDLSFLKIIKCTDRNQAFEVEGTLHEILWECHKRGEWYDLKDFSRIVSIENTTSQREMCAENQTNGGRG